MSAHPDRHERKRQAYSLLKLSSYPPLFRPRNGWRFPDCLGSDRSHYAAMLQKHKCLACLPSVEELRSQDGIASVMCRGYELHLLAL